MAELRGQRVKGEGAQAELCPRSRPAGDQELLAYGGGLDELPVGEGSEDGANLLRQQRGHRIDVCVRKIECDPDAEEAGRVYDRLQRDESSTRGLSIRQSLDPGGQGGAVTAIPWEREDLVFSALELPAEPGHERM